MPLNISLRVLEFEDEAYNLKVISLIPSCAVSEIVAVPPRRSQPHNLKGGSCVAHTLACPASPVKVCVPLLIFAFNLVPSWNVHTFFTISMACLL